MEQDPQDSARGCCTLKVPANTNGHSNDLFPHRPQSSDQKHLIENSHVIFLGCQNLLVPCPLLQKRLVLMGFQNLSPLPSGQKSLLMEFLCYWLFPAPRKEGNNCFGGQPSPSTMNSPRFLRSLDPPSQLLFFWRRHRSYRAWRSYEMQ